MQTNTVLALVKKDNKAAIRKQKKFKSKPAIAGITKGDVLRLAKKGGVGRLSVLVYEETKHTIKQF